MWRLGIIFAILLIAISNILSPLHARKLVHIGCGLTLAHINHPEPQLRAAIILIAVGSIIIFETFPLRFGVKNDIGIVWYNLVVLLVVALHLPLRVLLPVFIIDPVACIVGMSTSSKRWYRKKTMFGTFAAFIASYFSLYYVKDQHHRMLLTVILPLTEGIMDKYDNVGISMVVLSYYWAAQEYRWPLDFHIELVD